MKHLKQIITLILVVVTAYTLSAKDEKNATVKIKTSAVCGMCKERIEREVSFEKGVKKVTLDNETKVATIVYDNTKSNPDALKKAIAKIGYDADEVPANKEAHDKLPACCQKGNTPH